MALAPDHVQADEILNPQIMDAEMTLADRFNQILSDSSLDDDTIDEAVLEQRYRASDKAGALFELIKPFGWEAVLRQALDILENPERKDDWHALATLLFRADCHQRPLPMGWAYLVAVLARFQEMHEELDPNLVWSVVHNLKGVSYSSDWEPIQDQEVMAQRWRLAKAGRHAFKQETLFYRRWRIAEITRAVDPLLGGSQTYTLDAEVRSSPELAEVIAYIDFCLAMYPAAEQGHCDRLDLERKTRFSKLLASRDWLLVDRSGGKSAVACPMFFSDKQVGCSPRSAPDSETLPLLASLWGHYCALRAALAERFGIPFRLAAAWTKDESRDILSPENIRRVREAFKGAHNVVFGLHYYYRGGCSPSEFVFADFETYLSVVEASNPGDHFVGFSLADVLHLAFARFGDLSSDETIDPAKEQLAAVREILLADLNVTIIGRKLDTASGDLHCLCEGWYRLDEEECEETLEEWRNLEGELILFKDDDLEPDENGTPIETVSLPPGRSRVRALIDAKRPNTQGRTPPSGAY